MIIIQGFGTHSLTDTIDTVPMRPPFKKFVSCPAGGQYLIVDSRAAAKITFFRLCKKITELFYGEKKNH